MNKYITVVLIGLMLVNCNTQVKRVLESEILKKGDLIIYENELFTGIVYSVYDNRQFESETNYKDGKKDGLHRSWWYKNGQLQSEANFKDGKKDGLWKEWNVNGQLRSESNWKDGVQID